ncbi:50S ribosomal protein L4 [Agrococcus sp. SGAir0287]|nr:50S ribosomal protein L4 [Agrococcus sp. SGAir0287]QCR20078.1 50S ribosomal protein L4 [Agrococcus sp. SGAir0287]
MANKVDVLDAKGAKAGSLELPESLFDVQTNVPLIHQVVVAQLAAARQGTHKTKNRGEVSGAGRKPFKQKGTGRSRQGSIRQPEHRGGGVVHGPTPRDYSQRTPKKMIAAALRGALSDRARGGRLHVVESLVSGDVPSTKTAVALLASVATSKNVLVVLHRDEESSWLSVRNLGNVHVLTWDQLNAYDVLVSDDIVFTKAAYQGFVEARTGETVEVEAAKKAPKAKAAKADADETAVAEPATKAPKAKAAKADADETAEAAPAKKAPKAKSAKADDAAEAEKE